jgi:hypothetical protein
LIEFSDPEGEIAEGAAQKVTAMTEQTFGATFMGFERNGVLLVLPEPSEHGPTERQRQQGNQLAEPFSVAEVG